MRCPTFARRARVRAVAAIPAVGLLAGAAAGLFVPDFPRLPAFLRPDRLRRAVAVWAWRAGRARVLARARRSRRSSPAARCWPRDAWQRRVAAAAARRVRGARARRARARRTPRAGGVPEDDEAFAVVEGVLRADAAPTRQRRLAQPRRRRLESDGQRRRSAKAVEPASGGIVVTVVGSLAADRVDEWRAGRRVRLPVHAAAARRAISIPACPTHERALARRGTTLVGTVKSGALVEVRRARRLARRGDGARRARSRAARSPTPSAAGARGRRPSSPRSSSAIAPGSTTTCSGGCRRPARIT